MKSIILVFSLLTYSLVAAQTFNEVTQCPGGASPRADIVDCFGFNALSNCSTGTEATCATDNGLTDNSYFTGSSVNAAIEPITGTVGNGAIRFAPVAGATSTGTYDHILDANSDEIRIRYYLRYSDGTKPWVNYNIQGAPHGFAIYTTGPCSRKFEIESSSFGWTIYAFSIDNTGADSCSFSAGNWFDGEIIGTPEFKNGQTYLIEWAFKVDTSCSDVADAKGCNGVAELYVDGVRYLNMTDLNWGNVDSIANSGVSQFNKFDFFQLYYHPGIPSWEPYMVWDEIVIGNDADTAIGETAQSLTKGTGDANSPHYIGAYYDPAITASPTNPDPCKVNNDCSCPGTFTGFYHGTTSEALYDGGTSRSTFETNYLSISTDTVIMTEHFDAAGLGATSLECNGKGDYSGDERDGSIVITLESGETYAVIKGAWPAQIETGTTLDTFSFISGYVKAPSANDFSDTVCLAGLSNYEFSADLTDAIGERLCLVVNPATDKWAIAIRDGDYNSGAVTVLEDSAVDFEDDTWVSFEIGLNAGETAYYFNVNGQWVATGTTLPSGVVINESSSQQGFFWGPAGYAGTANFVVYYDNIRNSTVSLSDDSVGWGDAPASTELGLVQYLSVSTPATGGNAFWRALGII